MTTNQLRYWELQETKRTNLAKEQETERSNRANEREKRYATDVGRQNVLTNAKVNWYSTNLNRQNVLDTNASKERINADNLKQKQAELKQADSHHTDNLLLGYVQDDTKDKEIQTRAEVDVTKALLGLIDFF